LKICKNQHKRVDFRLFFCFLSPVFSRDLCVFLIYLGAWIRRLSDEKMQIKIKKSPCGRKEKQFKMAQKGAQKAPIFLQLLKEM
jgi:hypothetical protein